MNHIQTGASPNPSYEQEVQVVKGDVEVKVENINILNPYAMFENQINSGLIQIQSDGKIILNGTVDYNNRTLKKTKLKAGTYHGIEEQRIVHFFWDGYDGYLKRDTYTLTEEKEISGYLQDGTYNNVELQPMIYTGAYDANKSYTPHKEQKLPLTLGDIELCKIGDYKDYPFKNLTNGKWYWHKVIGKEILDRNNYLSRGDTGTNAYYLSTNIEGLNNNNIIVSYSNMFQPCAFVDRANGKDITYSQNGFINIRTANNTSIDWSNETNCKNWLDANNPLINYILAEPIDIEITDTTLINQLEAINNAISYYEQTNISGTSSGISPLFDVEAYQNTKLLLEDIINSN